MSPCPLAALGIAAHLIHIYSHAFSGVSIQPIRTDQCNKVPQDCRPFGHSVPWYRSVRVSATCKCNDCSLCRCMYGSYPDLDQTCSSIQGLLLLSQKPRFLILLLSPMCPRACWATSHVPSRMFPTLSRPFLFPICPRACMATSHIRPHSGYFHPTRNPPWAIPRQYLRRGPRLPRLKYIVRWNHKLLSFQGTVQSILQRQKLYDSQ